MRAKRGALATSAIGERGTKMKNTRARLLGIALASAFALVMCLAVAGCGSSGGSSTSSATIKSSSTAAASSAAATTKASTTAATTSSSSGSSSTRTAGAAVILDLSKAMDGVSPDANNEKWSEKQTIPGTDAGISVCGKARRSGYGYSVTLYFGSDSANSLEAIGSNLYACYVADMGLGSGSYTLVYSAGESEAAAQTYIATITPSKELYFKYWGKSGGSYMASATPFTGVASNVTTSSITIGSTSYTLTPGTMTATAK